MPLKIVLLFNIVCFAAGSQISELKCWTKRDKIHYAGPGLGQSSNISDTIECISKCREDPYCGAVDIDTNTKPNCWYQMSKLFVATKAHLKPKSTVTNYLYHAGCGKLTSGVDLSCWTVTTQHQLLGLKQTGKKNLTECLEECKKNSECRVVDWDTKTSPSCWVQTNPKLEVSLTKLKFKNTVTNFILDRNCLNFVRGLDLTYWRVSELVGYSGPGLAQVNHEDLKSCLKYCEDNEVCNMVDFDPLTKPPCWAQTTPFTVKRGLLTPRTACYNFYFLRDQYKQKKPMEYEVEEVTSCWLYQEDTGYSGSGAKNVGASNQNLCLEKCYDDDNCGAVLYKKSSQNCTYVHGLIDFTKFKKETGTTVYVPNRDCSKFNEEDEK